MELVLGRGGMVALVRRHHLCSKICLEALFAKTQCKAKVISTMIV